MKLRILYFSIAIFLLQPIKAQVYDFSLEDLQGNTVSLSELTGEQLTVIDFWATWCKPCLASLPKLSALSKEYAEKGVNFIGINEDGPRNQSKIKPFVASAGIEYPILLDPNNEIMNENNLVSLPTLIILNSDLEVIFFHTGYKPGDEDILRTELEKHLKPDNE